jgi:hypothetical protein
MSNEVLNEVPLNEIKNDFILCDGDRVVNTKYIRWIQRLNETMEICTKSTGCAMGKNTIKISKLLYPQSYSKLNVMFNEPNE